MSYFSKEQILRLTQKALRIRQSAGLSLYEPLGIFDFVEDRGVEVRFQNFPSMEGMYCPNPGPLILINSERPLGRQAFTCAHEFGHHVLKHGAVIDKLVSDEGSYWSNQREFEASCLGAAVLMPKIAVERAFAIRGWQPESATSNQIFIISSYLGVSYGGLITHMQAMLNLLSPIDAKRLLKIQPMQIKEELIGNRINGNLIIIDEYLNNKPSDAQVGDNILTPPGTSYEGDCIKLLRAIESGQLFSCLCPGKGVLVNKEKNIASLVRVSRQAYSGRNRYRFLEEADDD